MTLNSQDGATLSAPKGRRILLVDDDAELLLLLRIAFARAGFLVGTAGNGVEALKKAHRLRPDMIVLDAMMPELDGFAVCEILRRNGLTEVPIVMLTALSGQIPRLNAFEAGVSEFVTKPFSPRLLVERVSRLLDSSRAAGGAN